MVATREYINQHGKPSAFYSDRHAVFHVSKHDAHTERLTQFGCVLNDLNIELICANSSQAKGSVERANKTLQGHLVKEVRLKGINTIEQANVWLSDFIADFNRRGIPRTCIGLYVNPSMNSMIFLPSTKSVGYQNH